MVEIIDTDAQGNGVIDLNAAFIDFINNFRDKKGVAIYKEQLERVIKEKKHMLIIDFRDLERFNRDLARQFEIAPETTIESVINYLYVEVINDNEFKKDVRDLTIGIIGYDNIVPLSELGVDYLDKLITIEGIVSAVGEKKQHVLQLAVTYYYSDHGEVKSAGPYFIKQDYLSPKKTYSKYCDYCNKRPIKIELSDSESIKTDWQLAIIQEKPEKMKGGQTIPNKMKVVLTRDLVYSLHPGDVVKITGVLKTRSLENGGEATEDYYFVALGLEYEQMPYSDVVLTLDDLRKIEELKKNPKKLLSDVIDSIAPTIYGMRTIKEAIALALVGGTSVDLSDGKVRGDIHVLVIGEPGIGKTRLLKAISRVAPRSIYVSGEMATAVGISSGLVRDNDTGEWLIEAGALVLADRGVILIDEIDKLNPKDRVALREAMELQTVTLTKVKKAVFNARTTVIAAGNPKGDRFGPGNIFQYLDMDISLLTRFDLIFAVKEELDDKKVEFIVDATAKELKRTLKDFMYNPPLDPGLLKKIIVYARTNVFPQFSEEAKKELTDAAKHLIYLSQRIEELGRLISGREIDTLRRLATAYARLQLKEVVEKEDVEMAFNMVMESLSSLGFMGKDERGEES